MTTARVAMALVTSLVWMLLGPMRASALPFGASVQRFEADGNVYGSADGVFDLVDEFDDGLLAPNWALLLGTAQESGGVLTLRDPGVTVPFTGLPQEISTVESTAEPADGLGDFTITSYWVPSPLATNTQFFFQLYGTSPVIEATGLTVSNLDAATAAGAGAPVGYSVQFSRVFPLGNQLPPITYVVAIDPSDITGPIVLRLAFDDATDLMTGSLSLDGGATFQSPFPAIPAFELTPDGEVLLGAAAFPSPTPPGQCSQALAPGKVRFQRLTAPGGEQIVRMTGAVRVPPGTPAPFDPPSQGALFVAISGTGSLAAFAVPASGAPPNGGCGPRDGWSMSGRKWAYTNASGLVPPACTTAANGLRKVTFTDDRIRNSAIKFTLLARDTALQYDPGLASLIVGVGATDMQGQHAVCASRFVACKGSASSLRCQ